MSLRSLTDLVLGLRGKRIPFDKAESVLADMQAHPDIVQKSRKMLYGLRQPKTIADSAFIRSRSSAAERLAFYVLSAIANWDSYMARRELKAQLQVSEQPYGDITLDHDAASMVVRPAEWKLLQDLVAEANESFDTRMTNNLNAGKEVMRTAGLMKSPMESAIFAYARHPAILKIVCDYLGSFPVLLRINLLLSLNDRLQPNSSQFAHLDPEDFRQVKIFLYVNDVDENTGPYQVARADASDRVQLKYDYRFGRLTDEQLFSVLKPDEILVGVGPPGTAVFSDTSRGFHFGSRPAPKSRRLVMFQYVTAFAASYEIEAKAVTSKYTPFMQNHVAAGNSLSKFDEHLFALTR